MFDIKESLQNILDLLKKDSKKTLIACSILIFLCICAIIALAVGNANQKKLPKKITEEQKLVLDEPLLVPSAPGISDEYITTRKTEKNWNENEIEKWFTLPDENEVQKLGDSNDRIIQDIIGAAP